MLAPFTVREAFQCLLEDLRALNLRLLSAALAGASLLLAAGVNIYAVAAQLGHASATITWRVYGHLVPDGASPGAAAFHAMGGSTTVAEAGAENVTSGQNVVPMPVRTAS